MRFSAGSRSRMFGIHGVLALALGLCLLYLAGTMTNLMFEVIAVSIAMLLAAAALILAAVADWFAAFSAGIRHLHQAVFYLLGGAAFALGAGLLGDYPQISLAWLVVFSGIHAGVVGLFCLGLAYKAKKPRMYLWAVLSLGFAAVLFDRAEWLNNRSATVMLGAYTCFLGLKMLYLSWVSVEDEKTPEPVWRPEARS